LSGRGPKLIAILLVAIVIASGLGYWLLAPRKLGEIVSHTTQQASLSTTFEQTLATSTKSTAVTSASETTLWINVSGTKPVSYHLALLESNRTEPYVQLAKELRKLPGLTNATAVAKIVYLALNGTNPEVKEAFELMIKGGTPDPRDYTYSIPRYNTELQVLYWLALENEFKRDDTLALAIAMVNGLWVTVGNDQTKRAVLEDTTEVLRYFRETNDWQKSKGYHELENYPLEAKVCLAWTGNVTPVFGPFGLSDLVRESQNYMRRRLPVEGYLWNTISANTMREMRSLMEFPGKMLPHQAMAHRDLGQTIHDLEYYFYFMNQRGPSSEHWGYTRGDINASRIVLDGKLVDNYQMFNIDAIFHEMFLRTGKVSGNCLDETAWVDGWAKSAGIATTGLWHVGWDRQKNFNRFNHIFNIFYDPPSNRWKADDLHLVIGLGETYQLTHIFRPPLDQHGYLRIGWYDKDQPPRDRLVGLTGEFFYDLYDLSEQRIREMFLSGVQTAQMKQWLLYS
jgi:hypothetical protein